MLTANQKKNSAFSLVELLVVLAVIAIITAILLSVISRAKGKAVRLQCVNNVRQQGIALQEFKLDHSCYPAEFDPADRTETHSWQSALGNEMNINKNGQYFPRGVWHCPAASRPTTPYWTNQALAYVEYGYNAYGLGAAYFTNSLGLSEHWLINGVIQAVPKVRELQVASPSEMYAIGDAFVGGPAVIKDGMNVFGRANDSDILSRGFVGYDYAASTQRSYARHQGLANAAFCDGHVASLALKLLFVETNDAALSAWNRDNVPHRERLTP